MGLGLVVVVAGGSGCDKEVLHGLTERQANEVVVALASIGIEANKVDDVSDEGVRFKILTSEETAVAATKMLLERELPRVEKRGLSDIYGEPSMIPTGTEERARFLQGVQGDLSITLEKIDGVVDARVHVVLPPDDVLSANNAEKQRGRAAVLLKYRKLQDKHAGTDADARKERDDYVELLLALENDVRQVQRAAGPGGLLLNVLGESEPVLKRVKKFLDDHTEGREAKAARADVIQLETNMAALLTNMRELSSLPKIKDLEPIASKIKQGEPAQRHLLALPFSSASVRSIIAGAVEGIGPDDVAVEFARVIETPTTQLVVRKEAGTINKNMMVALLVAGVVLGMLLGALIARLIGRPAKTAAKPAAPASKGG